MESKNFIKQSLILIGLVVIFSVGLSFLPTNSTFFGISLKQVDMLSALKSNNSKGVTSADSTNKEYNDYMKEYKQLMNQQNDTTKTKNKVKKNKDQSFNFKFNQKTRSQKASLEFLPNLIKYLTDALTGKNLGKDNLSMETSVQTKEQKIIGNLSQMRFFYNALKQTSYKKIRVAHYGDSAIEGDLVTGELRYILQKKYGGKGVGWMAITSQDIRFRQTTTHSFSGNWEEAALFTSNPNNLPYGISGEVFVPKASRCWIQYVATSKFSTMRTFKTARLFYSNATSGNISYSFSNGASKKAYLKSGSGIKEIVMKDSRNTKKIRITFSKPDEAYFYGVSLENGNGIYVDNFPIRGNTGADLKDIKISTLKSFKKMLNYKLVIFQFGLNILGMIRRDSRWYEREMVKVINNFKKALPNTSFLLVSVGDKSVKRGSRFVTDPAIFKLLKVQLNITRKTNIAFWNLFEAMGGRNSMHKWVTNNPPLASFDHIHFNVQGAEKVGELLAHALIAGAR